MGDLDVPWGMGIEFVLFYRRGNMPLKIPRRNGVIHIPQIPPGKLLHPHEKPQPLLELFIKASTDPCDFIVDPFSGSASLARAARSTGRSALCIEKDPHNHKIAERAFHESGHGLF
jgi:DNA modification methylase